MIDVLSLPPYIFVAFTGKHYLVNTIVLFNPTVISRIRRDVEDWFEGSLHKREIGVVSYSLIIFPQYVWLEL